MMDFNKQLVSFYSLSKKEVKRFIRIWTQTLIPPIITTALYFFIFGNLIGSRIGEMEGVLYIDFIVPGLVIMSVITNAYTNVSSSFFGNKFQGSIEEILVSSTPNWVILAGFVCGGVVRGLLSGAVVLIIAALFTDIIIHNFLIIVIIAFLTAILFSLAGFLNGIFAQTFDDVSIIPTFILTPLIYLGGVFYPIALLPEPWKSISFANPIVYVINAFRHGFLGVSFMDVRYSFLLIIAFIIGFIIINSILLNKGYRLRK